MNKYLIEYRLDGEKNTRNMTVDAPDLKLALGVAEIWLNNVHYSFVSIGLLKYPDEELCADHEIPLIHYKDRLICSICLSSPIRGEE